MWLFLPFYHPCDPRTPEFHSPQEFSPLPKGGNKAALYNNMKYQKKKKKRKENPNNHFHISTHTLSLSHTLSPLLISVTPPPCLTSLLSVQERLKSWAVYPYKIIQRCVWCVCEGARVCLVVLKEQRPSCGERELSHSSLRASDFFFFWARKLPGI